MGTMPMKSARILINGRVNGECLKWNAGDLNVLGLAYLAHDAIADNSPSILLFPFWDRGQPAGVVQPLSA